MKVLFLLFCVMKNYSYYANASKIDIQIDSEDLFKVFKGIVNTYAFKDFAAQVFQRTDVKRGIYNNPYHPEDDTVNDNIERELAEKRRLFSIKIKQGNENKQKENEEKLDKDNANYILNGDNKSEEVLEDTSQTSTTKEVSNDDRRVDTYNFKLIQKRFLKKGS